MKRVGLIAGKGKLPRIWAQEASKKGIQVYAFSLFQEGTALLQDYCQEVRYFSPGELNKLLQSLTALDLKEVVMIGKVEKGLLFQGITLDERMKKFLASLPVLNDDNIMLAFVQELAQLGIEVIAQSTYLEELLPQPGVLTAEEISPSLQAEMDFAFRMAREIGRLDIGQTVVVKNKAVLAVEAIEGTDQAILRGGQLGGAGVVIAKVSKPQQDFRFDIPTVGLTTLENLIKIKARGLVIEAGRTFLIDREEFLSQAKAAGITVLAKEVG